MAVINSGADEVGMTYCAAVKTVIPTSLIKLVDLLAK